MATRHRVVGQGRLVVCVHTQQGIIGGLVVLATLRYGQAIVLVPRYIYKVCKVYTVCVCSVLVTTGVGVA